MKLRSFLVIASFIFSALLGVRAQAGCYEKFAFDQVRFHTQSALTNSRRLSAPQSTGLDRALRQLTIIPLSSLLRAQGMQNHAAFLNDFYAQLRILQKTGESWSTSLDAQAFEKAGQIFEELCAAKQTSSETVNTSEPKRILERIESILKNPALSGSTLDIRSFANLSLVFFVLLGLVSFIVFCWKAYVIAFPLLMNRKTCKIQATLKVLDANVPGNLMVLGTRGFRFIPSDAVLQEGLIELLKTLTALPIATIVIQGEAFKVDLLVVSSAHCVSEFVTRLDRKVVSRLYSYSTVATHYKPKITVRPNLSSINPNFA